MTSVLNVDTIAAKDGTSPVALTKQLAPKAVFGMNLSSTTYAGVAQNSLPSNTLNIASGTDAGNGLARGECLPRWFYSSKQYTKCRYWCYNYRFVSHATA